MSVSATVTSKITALETLGDTFLSASSKTVLFDGLDVSAILNSGSSPPVTKVVAGEITLSAGAATLDLRAILGANGATIDGNGLKVQGFILKGKTGNTNPVTIIPGANNPYKFIGGNIRPTALKVVRDDASTFWGVRNPSTGDYAGGAGDTAIVFTITKSGGTWTMQLGVSSGTYTSPALSNGSFSTAPGDWTQTGGDDTQDLTSITVIDPPSTVTLKAGDRVHCMFNETLEDIDGTHKTMDLVGTGTEVVQYLILMG